MIQKTHPSTEKTYQGLGYWPSTGHFHTDPPPKGHGCPSESVKLVGATGLGGTVVVPGDTITYENSGKRQFNYCRHTKDTYEYLQDVPYWFWSSCTHSGYKGSHRWTRGGAFYAPTRPGEPLLPDVTTDMRARAWQKLLPKLETGFSMALFLWELKDIPRLLSDVRRVERFARQGFPRDWRKVVGTKTAAQLHLTWSFAIAPFIRDIESIISLVDFVNKRVNEFVAKGRKAQSFHYREEVASSTERIAGTLYRSKIVETKAEYFATLRCKYEYKKPSFLSSALRMWGLRLTPETVWNAIPFSFVVDWILKIGQALPQFDRDSALTVEIIDYCDTVKSTIILTERASNRENNCDVRNGNCGHVGKGGTVIWRWARSDYERTPCLPYSGYSFPVLDSLSMRELVLGAALLRT